MRHTKVKDADEALERAKDYAHRTCGDLKKGRKWLESPTPIPYSYGSKDYAVRVMVLEGSPPKAIIMAAAHWVQLIFWSGERKVWHFYQ